MRHLRDELAAAGLELGLRYTPVSETFRRTIEWAVGEGLVKRPTSV